jgi:SNF2 family DNA or RNA helicase
MNVTPFEYQSATFEWAMNRLWVEDQLGAGILADPGLGKTLMALMIANRLRFYGACNKFLIIAPKRVIGRTWPMEIKKFGFDFSYQVLTGTQEQRKRKLFSKPHEIDFINPEGVLSFLDKHKGKIDYDCVIVDESTKFKNHQSQRFRAWDRIVKKIERRKQKKIKRLILTGTPAANCLGDLFAQIYMIDDGATLGKTLGYFRARFMEKGGHGGWQWLFREDREEAIYDAIKHLVYRLDIEDHLDMPDRVWNKVWVDLPEPVKQRYDELESELFYRMDNGENILASGGGGLYSMCRTLAGGGLYEHPEIGPRLTHHIHEAKTETFADLVDELGGKPVIGAYYFDQDLERLKKKYKDAPVINGSTSEKRANEILDEWDKQNIHVLLLQPMSTEHGLNLQYGGCNDIIWYTLPDRPESYLQLNARLWRHGVVGQVRYHHLMGRGTIDIPVFDRLQIKTNRQTALMKALKEYRRAKESGTYMCA